MIFNSYEIRFYEILGDKFTHDMIFSPFKNELEFNYPRYKK